MLSFSSPFPGGVLCLRRLLASAAERGPPPGPAQHGRDDDGDGLRGRPLAPLRGLVGGRDPGADVRRLLRGVDGRQLALQVRARFEFKLALSRSAKIWN